jgi:site-specific DNA recombinase
MDRAWAFYRRSTNLQELSIDDQRRECEAFASDRGWEVVRDFVPARGYASGMTINRDPTFLEMIALAEQGRHGVQHLLVYDVSRFGRLPAKLKIYYEQHFLRFGIRVAYVKDNFRDDGTIGDEITQLVKHSEAHQYSVKLSELVLRGCKSHAALGHSTGGAAPFGYDRMLVDQAGNPVKILNKGEHKADKLQRVLWAPSPSEGPIIREIFETYARGIGVNTIVHGLNVRKARPPRGLYWGKSCLRALLRNRAYLGERTYNRRSYKSYRRGEKGDLFNPKGEWIVKGNAHEPLISPELFERVQGRFGSWKSRVGGAQRRPYTLSGLCVCSRCGYKLVGQQKTSGKGYRATYYACSGYIRCGRSVCSSLHLPTEQLESIILQAIRDNLNDPSWKEEIQQTLAGMLDAEFGAAAEQRVDELKAEMMKITNEIENMIAAIQAGTFSPALAAALKASEARQEDLKLRLRQGQGKVDAKASPPCLMNEVLALASQFEDAWRRCTTPELKKDLIQGFVYQVNINREGARLSADCWLWKIPQMTTAQHSIYGTPGRLSNAPERAYLSGALRGLDLPLREKSYEGILPCVNVRRYPILPCASMGSGLR